jgi:hypothetical protein
MEENDREMEIIALLSNVIDGYTYINCEKDVIEHVCEKTNERIEINLVEVEYFKDGHFKEDRANFCEHCNQVFIYKPDK